MGGRLMFCWGLDVMIREVSGLMNWEFVVEVMDRVLLRMLMGIEGLEVDRMQTDVGC